MQHLLLPKSPLPLSTQLLELHCAAEVQASPAVFLQAVKGLMEIWPAAQSVQAPPLPAEVLPALQLTHEVKGLVELLPAAQLVQAPTPLAEV